MLIAQAILAFRLIISRFTLSVNSLSWESNFERTRWFLILGIEKPHNNELNRLLHLSNTAAREYDQPLLYENETTEDKSLAATQLSSHAKRKGDGAESLIIKDHTKEFHISIAWTLQKPCEAGKERLSTVDISCIKNIRIPFDCMKARIGNYVITLPFSTNDTVRESGIGLV